MASFLLNFGSFSLRSFWHHFDFIVNSFWLHFNSVLAPFLLHFGSILAPFASPEGSRGQGHEMSTKCLDFGIPRASDLGAFLAKTAGNQAYRPLRPWPRRKPGPAASWLATPLAPENRGCPRPLTNLFPRPRPCCNLLTLLWIYPCNCTSRCNTLSLLTCEQAIRS